MESRGIASKITYNLAIQKSYWGVLWKPDELECLSDHIQRFQRSLHSNDSNGVSENPFDSLGIRSVPMDSVEVHLNPSLALSDKLFHAPSDCNKFSAIPLHQICLQIPNRILEVQIDLFGFHWILWDTFRIHRGPLDAIISTICHRSRCDSQRFRQIRLHLKRMQSMNVDPARLHQIFTDSFIYPVRSLINASTSH